MIFIFYNFNIFLLFRQFKAEFLPGEKSEAENWAEFSEKFSESLFYFQMFFLYAFFVLDLEILKIFTVSVLAGIVVFFSAMTGTGSGIVLVPLLISFGLSPVQAIAVHKFEATIWTSISAFRYAKNRQVLFLDFPWYLILGSIGTFFGAKYIHFISSDQLRFVIGGAILFVAVWIIVFQKKSIPKNVSLWKRIVLIFSMFVFGLYEGTFGSGNGYFIAALFFGLVGSDELKTVGMITLLAAFWNLVAVFTHYSFGSLVFQYAIPVSIGAGIGAWLGAGYAIHRGRRFVRWIIVGTAAIAGLILLI